MNIFDENALAEELQGKDALVSCLAGSWSLFNRIPVTIYTDSAKVFASAARTSGVSRLVIMSGWPITGMIQFYHIISRIRNFNFFLSNILLVSMVLMLNYTIFSDLESYCWFSFALAFQLFRAVEPSSLFHLCNLLTFLCSRRCSTNELGSLHAD